MKMVVKGHFYGIFCVLWQFCRHLVGIYMAVYSLFFYALVCADVTEPSLPSGNEDRRGGVKQVQKDPHPRNLEQGSIVIQLRIFAFVRLRLNCLVPKHSNPCAWYYTADNG